MPSIVVEGDR